MKPVNIIFQRNDRNNPLYMQLYQYLRDEIISGSLKSGTCLPSLRLISKELEISVTTAEQAYSQLSVEGYIEAKPKSGYYVADIPSNSQLSMDMGVELRSINDFTLPTSPYIIDPASFDFTKWRKVMLRVLADYNQLLFCESDPQGEAALRYEISKYVYSSRGVRCHPDQIIVGAGTQQLTAHIGRLLKSLDIHMVSTEDPGYLPVRRTFEDQGFLMTSIPVTDQGIMPHDLPRNIPTALYVCPNNQFPTGAVMPIANRYKLIEWAIDTNSVIIEDDYDSELRYFGRPIPALQGIMGAQSEDNVIYLGSFSATLFPAIKVSYMVLPNKFLADMDSVMEGYNQACSKIEQLTLAFFMEDGHYYTNIKKLRNLYGQKLNICLRILDKYGKSFVTPENTASGLNLILRVHSNKTAHELSRLAANLGLMALPVSHLLDDNSTALIFYYTRIPLEKLEPLIVKMLDAWKEER